MTLECCHISKAFGGVQALADVSIRFPPEGIVAVIGANGAGKTTLIDTVTGIVRPDRGQWLLDGRDITGLSTEKVAQTGIARSFQGIRLLPDETVLDNIALAVPDRGSETLFSAFLHFKTSTRRQSVVEEANRLAGLAGLNGRRHDSVRWLSYGEQKLVSAVVTAATGARILLFDEPLAGVHGDGVGQIVSFAQQLASNGRLVVFIEHDLAAVRRLAATTVLMDHGTVLAVGPTAEVLERGDLLEAYLG
jgi:ABC-type branched-subunit amino acid transport system ATPase component